VKKILMIPLKMMTQRQILGCHSRMGILTAMPTYDNLDRYLPTIKLLQRNGCNNMRLRQHCLKQDQRGGQKRHNQNNVQKFYNPNNVQKPVSEQLNGEAYIKLYDVNNNSRVLLPTAQQINREVHNSNVKDLYQENNMTMIDL